MATGIYILHNTVQASLMSIRQRIIWRNSISSFELMFFARFSVCQEEVNLWAFYSCTMIMLKLNHFDQEHSYLHTFVRIICLILRHFVIIFLFTHMFVNQPYNTYGFSLQCKIKWRMYCMAFSKFFLNTQNRGLVCWFLFHKWCYYCSAVVLITDKKLPSDHLMHVLDASFHSKFLFLLHV